MIDFLAQLSRNERQVLNAIWRHGPIARAELVDHINLTTGSLTRITQLMAEQGLLTETVRRSGGRGNPMRPLEIRAEGAYAFGVNFSHRYMDVGVVDLSGALRGSVRREFAEANPEVIVSTTRDAVDQLMSDCGIEAERVLGLCFAAPGEIRPDGRGIYPHPYFPKLKDIDLIGALGRDMPFPVFIENDCRCGALGERVLGVGRTFDNFFCAYVCHGVGGAIVEQGALQRGAHGNAGGLHVFFPLSQPRPSGHDLFDVLAREGQPVRDFCDLEAPGSLDLPGVRPWIARASAQLRDALTVVSRLLDPQAVVIAGRLPPAWLEAIAEAVDDPMFCADSLGPKPKLVASQLGPRAGVIGAAASVFYRTFLQADRPSPRDNLVNRQA